MKGYMPRSFVMDKRAAVCLRCCFLFEFSKRSHREKDVYSFIYTVVTSKNGLETNVNASNQQLIMFTI